MVATEPPTPGTMPMSTPNSPERRSRSFMRENMSWKILRKMRAFSRMLMFCMATACVLSCLPSASRSRCGTEKTPSMTGMKGIPPIRMGMSKSKRGLPMKASAPIQVMNTPRAAEAMPLRGSPALMEPTSNRPMAASANISPAPKWRTAPPSMGMQKSMTRPETIPPEKLAILEMNRASRALPW